MLITGFELKLVCRWHTPGCRVTTVIIIVRRLKYFCLSHRVFFFIKKNKYFLAFLFLSRANEWEVLAWYYISKWKPGCIWSTLHPEFVKELNIQSVLYLSYTVYTKTNWGRREGEWRLCGDPENHVQMLAAPSKLKCCTLPYWFCGLI